MTSKHKKSGSDKKSGSNHKFKGKIIYFSFEGFKEKIGDADTNIVEKKVKHSDNEFFCKYYEKKDGKVTKVSVIAPTDGGDYSLITTDQDNETVTETLKKKALLDKLGSKDYKKLDLSFMLNYINKTKALMGGGALMKGGARKKKNSTGTKKAAKKKTAKK